MSAATVPTFCYCESVHTDSATPWHIRKPTSRLGLRLQGGIDTASLCKRLKPRRQGGTGGWDLPVPVTDKQDGVCPNCFAEYQRQRKADTMNTTIPSPTPAVGQRWADNDKRCKSQREVVIRRIVTRKGLILADRAKVAECDVYENRVKTRSTVIRLNRFKPTATGYRYVGEGEP